MKKRVQLLRRVGKESAIGFLTDMPGSCKSEVECTVVSPYPGTCSKSPSGCLKLQRILNPIHTVFPIFTCL